MPVRRKLARQQTLSTRVIEQLRAIVRAGEPWGDAKHSAGFFDVHGLIAGDWFGFAHYVKENDVEAQRFLWDELKDDIMDEHIKRAPLTRPWGWWEFEAPEKRRVVCRDSDEDDQGNGEDDSRLPAFEDPELPEHFKRLSFGLPCVYDGFLYESQYTYLQRLNLLTPAEKEISEKYGNVVMVRRALSSFVRDCAPCWQTARAIAAEIGFDLDAQIKGDNFWIPAELFFACDHEEHFHGEDSIFDEVDTWR
jgi:hypothetical protein